MASSDMNAAIKKEVVINDCRLILGDCLEVMPLLGNVDAVVTDPPYGIEGGSGGDARKYAKGRYHGPWKDTPEYIQSVVVPALRLAIAHAKSAIVTPGSRNEHLYPLPADKGCFFSPAAVTHGRWGFTNYQPILYYGKDPRAGTGSWPTSRVLTEAAEKCGHPCPKPINAWKWLVEKSALCGAVILDPFMGSGTTGVACVKTGRQFIGIELDPDYFEIACERIRRAYEQPDMFVEQARALEPKQDNLFGPEAAE